MVIDASLLRRDEKKKKQYETLKGFGTTIGKAFKGSMPVVKTIGRGTLKFGKALTESSAEYYGTSLPQQRKKKKHKQRRKQKAKAGRSKTITIKLG